VVTSEGTQRIDLGSGAEESAVLATQERWEASP
jgi:hypothetical protein